MLEKQVKRFGCITADEIILFYYRTEIYKYYRRFSIVQVEIVFKTRRKFRSKLLNGHSKLLNGHSKLLNETFY